VSGPDGQAHRRVTTCPSAPPEPGSALLGVVMGPGQIAFLNPGIPATQEMIDSLVSAGIPIENRMRFSGPCMEHRCVQWGGEGGGRAVRTDRPRAGGAQRYRGRGDPAALLDPRYLPLVRSAQAQGLRGLPRGDPPSRMNERGRSCRQASVLVISVRGRPGS
jgi:hypothetical protein